jgi:hypothetical protein
MVQSLGILDRIGTGEREKGRRKTKTKGASLPPILLLVLVGL